MATALLSLGSAPESEPAPSNRKGSLFESARRLQEQRRWEEAISTYRQLDEESQRVTTGDAHRGTVLWHLAECYFGKGDYRAALDAMAMSMGQDSGSWCGTGRLVRSSHYWLRVSVLNEYLGDYDAAVAGYLDLVDDHPGVATHLMELYEKAGQLPVLLRLVDTQDRDYAERVKRSAENCIAGRTCPPEHSRLYRRVHETLRTRDLESRGDWDALVSALNPRWNSTRAELFSQREAAHLLALHPAESIPLLVPHLRQNPYCAYALVRTGSPEAIAAVKKEMTSESNWTWLLWLMDAILSAGANGAAVLRDLDDELYPTSEGNLRGLLDHYRAGTLDEWLGREGFFSRRSSSYEEFAFPPPLESMRLPNRCVRQEPDQLYQCGFQSEAPAPGSVDSP